MQYVISVDPGLQGSLCLYNISTSKVIEVLNTPTYKKDKKTWLHCKNIYIKLHEWSLLTNKVIIETQTITGRDGNKSAMTTLKNYGMLIAILSILDFIIEEVAANHWQSIMLKDVIDPGEPIKMKPTKRKAMVLTKEFNPKGDGQADAISLALFYAKTHKT